MNPACLVLLRGLFALRRLWLFGVLLLCVNVASALPPWEDGRSRGEDLEIQLYTVGPGEAMESWWGHQALLVRDNRFRSVGVYNWGMFRFDENLIRNFLIGKLWFWVDAQDPEGLLAYYRREGREIRVTTLNLPPERKLRLVAAIAENMKEENREYQYEYFRDNCATRVRDLLDQAMDGQISAIAKRERAALTWRQHVSLITAHHQTMGMLLKFMLGPDVDRSLSKWDEMFLPDEVEKFLVKFEYEDFSGRKIRLAQEPQVILPATLALSVPSAVPTSFPWDLMLGATFATLPFFSFVGKRTHKEKARRWINLFTAAAGLVVGIPGAVLAYFMTATYHVYTFANENILLGNPITLLLLPLGLAGIFSSKWSRRAGWVCHFLFALSVCGLFFRLTPYAVQQNAEFLRLLVPIWGALSVSHWILVRRP